MTLLTQLRLFLNTKNTRTLFIYYGIFLGILITTSGIIIYSHFLRMAKLSENLKVLKKQRETAQQIFIKNKQIITQKETVKTLLEQEPNFYIGQYFTDLMKETPFAITSGPDLGETDVGNGFTERKLSVTFSHITMKQLTEFILKIEQKERVYTKEIKIVKDVKDGLLNVTLTIATLEPQQVSV